MILVLLIVFSIAFLPLGRSIANSSSFFDQGIGSKNQLKLVVSGNQGAFFVNEIFISSLNLSNHTKFGDIFVASGINSGNIIEDKITTYENFTVWAFQADESSIVQPSSPAITVIQILQGLIAIEQKRVFGPNSGNLQQKKDNLLERQRARVNLRNFVVQAVFNNPYPSTEEVWDIGFLFRNESNNNQLQLIIDSQGKWLLGDRRYDTWTVIAEGDLTNLDLNPNGANSIVLSANNDVGILFVNNELISFLDLSSRTNAGDISIATGLQTNHEIEGKIFRYTGFSINALP